MCVWWQSDPPVWCTSSGLHCTQTAGQAWCVWLIKIRCCDSWGENIRSSCFKRSAQFERLATKPATYIKESRSQLQCANVGTTECLWILYGDQHKMYQRSLYSCVWPIDGSVLSLYIMAVSWTVTLQRHFSNLTGLAAHFCPLERTFGFCQDYACILQKTSRSFQRNQTFKGLDLENLISWKYTSSQTNTAFFKLRRRCT